MQPERVHKTQNNLLLEGCFALSGESASLQPSSFYCLISLTKGKFAIVDKELYDWLNQWKWYANWKPNPKSFYAMRNPGISMAREVLGLKKGDKRIADHINHNTLDNRISNLRIVSNQKNQFNRKSSKGFIRHKLSQKFQARITVNGKKINLGCYSTKQEAHSAYLEAKNKYHCFSI